MSLASAYDELKEDEPCQVCGKIDEEGILCDQCDKAYHKDCLKDLYVQRNPLSWFCPACEKHLLDSNGKDPYYDHQLLTYLITGMHKEGISIPQQHRVEDLAQHYRVEGEELMKRIKKQWIVVPSPANRSLFTQIQHEQFGHCGRDKLRQLLSRQYWWPKMDETIAQVLLQCVPCIKSKHYKTHPKGNLYPTEKGYQPFQIWAIDLMPSLPSDDSGDSVVAVAVDCFSKWVEIAKFPNKTPHLLAEWFEKDIIARYGIPKIVRSDNGTEFEGEFQQLMKVYGITRRTTSPSHPQANGQAERTIQAIKSSLRKFVDGGPEQQWSSFIPEILFYLRFTKSRATNMSPFQVIYGFEPDLPSPITTTVTDTSLEEYEDMLQYEPQSIITFFQTLHENVKQELAIRDISYQDQYKKTIEKLDKLAPTDIQQGDLVLIKQRKSGGLRLPTMGPFKFKCYRGKDNNHATVEGIQNAKEFSVATSHLIKFVGEMTPVLLSQSRRLTELLEMKPPAPRGRPRKRPLEPIVNLEGEKPAPRKRGRPRKYPR